MLNRLFIIVGVVAILAIAAAFVAPSFIPWGEYRERLAAIASEVFGEPVRIEGDIAFTLLPSPKLQFSGVSAGPEEAPVLTVERVEAEFSLIDFLRDRYNVTRLVLDRPATRIDIGADGAIATGIALAQSVDSNVSVANATLTGGSLTLSDARTGRDYVASDIAGDLRIEALRGPFSFQGTGNYEGRGYTLRLATGALATEGGGTLNLSLQPADQRFAFAAEGNLSVGVAPAFTGTMTWRQPPARVVGQAPVDAGQGDLLMTSKLAATTSRVLLTDYVLVPDENRGATRLQGAAEISLGRDVAFNAVISGGVLALPPRDATAEQAVEPYEIVRLLTELPVPPVPGIPGTIGLDIAEVDLRAVALRNVRLDARAGPRGWVISNLTGTLPGDATLTLAGDLDTARGRPEFAGSLSLRSSRLDALSTLWRGLAPGNPLFGMPGGLEARLNLVGETLSISDATIELDGQSIPFDAQLGLGANRDLHLSAELGDLDPARSNALLALLPDLGTDLAFPVTFPKGEFDLTASRLTVAGLDGRDLSARGSWEGGVLVIDDISAADFGGASFNAALTAFGSVLRPELSGTANIALASADAPALARLYAALGAPANVAGFLANALPADLQLTLDAPNGEGAQSLRLTGTAATSTVTATAELQAGILRAPSGRIAVRGDVLSDDVADLTHQLGLANADLFAPGAPGHLVVRLDGNLANSVETTLRLSSDADSIGFAGNVVVTDPAAYSGRGTLKLALSDASALANLAGASGISLPSLELSSALTFDGADDMALEGITGTAAGVPVTGNLDLRRQGSMRGLTGQLGIESIDLAGIVGALAGPAALLPGSGIWPDGPIAIGDTPRTSTGRIGVTVPVVTVAGQPLGSEARFDFDWDATSTRLRNASVGLGAGTASFDVAVCCAGPLPGKQVTGRYALTDVALADIIPPATAAAISGALDASGRFDGTAESLAQLLASMTGDGTFTLRDFAIARFDASAAGAATGIENIFDMQPEEVIGLIEERLDDAPFAGPEVSGTYTIGGGTLRSPNLVVDGTGGRLFGSGAIRLTDLGLTGTYTLTPTTTPSATADGQIAVRLGGTLLAPERTFDLSALVDSIMVRAYEAEVARLEQLRAEDEARQRAAAEEAARLAAEEAARLAAEEAARRAAEEEAARAAEAQRAAEEEALRRAVEQLNQPMDLGL
ncbi:MAG: AsmA family protein [Devosia sp.]